MTQRLVVKGQRSQFKNSCADYDMNVEQNKFDEVIKLNIQKVKGQFHCDILTFGRTTDHVTTFPETRTRAGDGNMFHIQKHVSYSGHGRLHKFACS